MAIDPTSPLDRVAGLFDEALSLPTPSRREAFVARVRSDDPGLGEELEALLQAHFAESRFLEDPLPEELSDLVATRLDAALVGRTLGSWQIAGVIHRGGMGTVYRARRVGADFEQEAALKVIRTGHESPDFVRRFALERQVLARLEHPNIARLLDGGTTADDLPFLVMEYVPGMPIDAWCDRHRPSTEQLLDLFSDVARAVHFAHQNLVIHRDIKPSNILVTEDGTPKLLDFGIAKLLEPGPEEPGAADLTVHRILTPAYASPEQFQGAPVGIGTDVYSLGVLLYRLLSGEAPYQISREQTAREAERLICETMPLPPSAHLSGPEGRRRRLRGDLDTIVLKALRKEPERRYGSVLSLVDDLDRFRSGLPVAARPDTLGYRAGRFLHRNRLAAGALVAVFAALAAGLGAALWQAGVAQRERDLARAEALTAESAVEFLKTVLWAGNPWADAEPIETVDDVLRYAEAEVDPALGDQPLARAYILAAMAEIAVGRGELERALRFSQASLRVVDDELAGEHPRLPTLLRARALALHEAGEVVDAREVALAAIRGFRAQEAPSLRPLAMTLSHLGALEVELGNGVEAEESFREAMEVHRAMGYTHPGELAIVLNNLAGALQLQPGRTDEVAAAHEEAIRLARVAGAGLASQGTLLSNLAGVLWALDRLPEAEAAYREATDALERALGLEHPSTLIARISLANFLEALDQLDEAEGILRPVMESAETTLPPGHFVTAYARNVLSTTLCRRGGQADASEGLVLARASLEARRALLPEGHWALASGASVEGRCLAELGQLQEARPLLAWAVEELTAQRGPDQELTRRARRWLESVDRGLGAGS